MKLSRHQFLHLAAVAAATIVAIIAGGPAAAPWLPGNSAICYRPRRSGFICGMWAKVSQLNADQQHERRKYQMKSNRSTLAATAVGFVRLLAFCIPMMMLLNAASANDPPTAGASKMPGAKGTIEYKPEGWKGTGVTTYWKDSDGIKPGVAGCHVEVTKGGKSFTGRRVFGEACLDGLLVESNPGRNVIHPHKDDLGHPDTFDCNAWCIGAQKAKAGLCVKVAGPSPCAESAKCECSR